VYGGHEEKSVLLNNALTLVTFALRHFIRGRQNDRTFQKADTVLLFDSSSRLG